MTDDVISIVFKVDHDYFNTIEKSQAPYIFQKRN